MTQLRNQTALLLLLCCFARLAWGQTSQFVSNKGQWDQRAKYRLSLPQGFVFLEERGFTYKLYHPDFFERHAHHDQNHIPTRIEPRKVDGHVLKARFLGASTQGLEGRKQTNTLFNFYHGSDPSRWAGGTKGYLEIAYQELYPKTHLRYYMVEGALKYDLILEKGANPDEIAFTYEGNEGMALVEGSLRVQTSFHWIDEKAPIAYQDIDGERVEVPVEFKLEGEVVSYYFPEGYDHGYELIIDPEIVFSTFSGSTQDNWGFTATYDEAGNAYTAGITRANGDFPTTPGAFQETPSSLGNGEPATTDIGILKFNEDGTDLIYATYLGGLETDVPHSMVVNNRNQLVMMGTTSSSDFPVTSNAFDRSFGGGQLPVTDDGFPLPNAMGFDYNNGSDIFIAVFSEDGSRLEGSSYLGGRENDGLDLSGTDELVRNYGDFFRGEVIVDAQDRIYLAGVTQSPDFPLAGSVFQEGLGGRQDGILCRMSPDVSSLEWSGFFGGSGVDGIFSIRLSQEGDIVMCGGTTSPDFPTTLGAVNPGYSGRTDGFVATVSSNGASLLHSTLLGTNQYDQAYLLDLDGDGNVVVIGQTLGQYPISSPDLFSNPNSGQFIHKLTPDLKSTLFSTVFGSGSSGSSVNVNIRPTAFLVSDCGDMYLTGWGGVVNGSFIGGSTNGMPVKLTEAPVIAKGTTDGSDFYLMQLSADAKELQYAAFLGGDSADGDHVDGGTSRFDKRGVVYQAACVCRSNSFPSTAGVFAGSNRASGLCNNLVFKFTLEVISAQVNPKVPDETGQLVETTSGCAPLTLTFTPEGVKGDNLQWDFGDGTTVSQSFPVALQHTFENPGTYQVSLQSIDPTTCEKVVTAVKTIEVFPANFAINEDQSICEGEEVQLLASGGEAYTWIGLTESLSGTDIADPVAAPTETTTYEVEIENEFGCVERLQTTVIVNEGMVELDSQWVEYCDQLPDINISAIEDLGGLLSWTLNGESFDTGGSNAFTFSPPEFGNYEFVGSYAQGACFFSDTIAVEVLEDNIGRAFEQAELQPVDALCEGDTVELSVTPGFTYQWSPEEGLSSTTSATIEASPSETTLYTVRVFGGKPTCFVDREVEVVVAPAIDAAVDFSFRYNCGGLVEVLFNNQTTDAESYQWLWEGERFSALEDPSFQPTAPGDYEVKLLANNFRCTASTSFTVSIPEVVFPPNVITPNNDGKNDTFVVAGVENWTLQIYDRWGKLVLETGNYQNDWAGEGSSGDTFYYLLTAPDGTQCKGTIQVLGRS